MRIDQLIKLVERINAHANLKTDIQAMALIDDKPVFLAGAEEFIVDTDANTIVIKLKVKEV